MDEEIIRRLLNKEYPNVARFSSTRDRCRDKDRDRDRCRDRFEDRICDIPQQSHDHELEASTLYALDGYNRHNHRFAAVTSEVIPLPCGNHKHSILVNTDSYGHHHEIATETGPAIEVGNGKHIHFVSNDTTLDDFHFHECEFVTSIENPLIKECCECECRCEFNNNNR